MWKCFNRGVWETIDRSVNVFKTDTSNGTCLISSLAKDFDGKSEESIRNTPQPCSENKSGICKVSNERNALREYQVRRKIVNKRSVKVYDHARTSKDFSHDLRHFKAAPASQNFDQSPALSNNEEINIISHGGRHQPPRIFHSCIGRTIHGKCERECKCNGRPSPDSDYIAESHHVHEVRLPYADASRKASIKWKFQSQSLCKSTKSSDFPEVRENLNSTSKSHETCRPKDKFSSLFIKVASLHGGQDVEQKEISSSDINFQSQDSVHLNSRTKSNVMLKFPFFCNDLGIFKGLNKVSAYWLMKPQIDFRRGDSGGNSGQQRGESEETKENAWKECQMHQSFLEAIRWSSAVLLGWFLGQFRYHHLRGELKIDDNIEDQSKFCIIESLSKLLVTWKCDTALPLKVLPSKAERSSEEYIKKKGSKVHGSETTTINDPYKECPPNPFPFVESEENNLCDGHSTRNHVLLQKTEDKSYHKGHLNPNLSSVDGIQKRSSIPLSWSADSVKNLKYGPITLEEAVKEAEKGLEEAQAEVLLTLALEKLNEGCSFNQKEPLPADLLQSAASLGNAAAAFNLGICYEKGVGGVVKNLVQAYRWYKQASEQGHAAATYNLAIFHANGLGGLHPNTLLANQLILKASALGLEEATTAVALISSVNSSEVMFSNKEWLYLRNQVSLDQDNEESSNSFITHNLSNSHSPVRNSVQTEPNPMNMVKESYHGGSDDLSVPLMSIGAASQPSKCNKEISTISSLKIGHFPMSHGIALSSSIDTERPLIEEMMLNDHHYVNSPSVDNSSVQLLAH